MSKRVFKSAARVSCAAAALLAMTALSAPAFAATVNCPGTAATSDREFSVTTSGSAVCVQTGIGNLPTFANLTVLDSDIGSINGYASNSTEGSLNFANVGQQMGNFSINIANIPNAASFTSFYIAFQAGTGGSTQFDPDYALFSLPNGVLSGSFTINPSNQQGLQGAVLYGATAVPGPLAGAGLVPLLGVAGAWIARRRRKKLAA